MPDILMYSWHFSISVLFLLFCLSPVRNLHVMVLWQFLDVYFVYCCSSFYNHHQVFIDGHNWPFRHRVCTKTCTQKYYYTKPWYFKMSLVCLLFTDSQFYYWVGRTDNHIFFYYYPWNLISKIKKTSQNNDKI
jgi:hypothetical protein